MRISVLAGLFACAVVFTLTTEKSSAASLELLQSAKEPSVITILDDVAGIEPPTATDVELAKPITKEHVVAENETLSTIAKLYGTTWQRLFDKNVTIENPDVITVGDVIVIPSQDEVLTARPLPVVVPPRPVTSRSTYERATTTVASAPADASGNRYVKGYCTWYVKNRRPDLPNNLGNAATWTARAAAQGYSTGSTPVVGAVGQQGNHVVYVEAVNGDGTVTVSEMNWDGWNVISSRTVAASNFVYIY